MTKPPLIGRHLIRALLLALIAVGLVSAAVTASAPASDAVVGTISGPAIVRYYTMNARVRPLLLWINRQDIGGARIAWTPTTGTDVGIEMLVGSDPDRAPWALNRWGFLAEQREGDTTRLTGVMTETDEQLIDGARSAGPLPSMPSAGGMAFHAVQSTIVAGHATTSFSRVVLDGNPTYRQYTTLLDRLSSAGNGARRVATTSAAEPGFLIAIKRLVHESVDAWQAARASAPRAGLRRTYLYMGKVYDLTLRRATLVDHPVVNGRAYGPAIDGEFRTCNLQTGTVTDFRMMFGLTGAESETPLRIVYRPRWWMELELLLEDTTASKMAMSMRR